MSQEKDRRSRDWRRAVRWILFLVLAGALYFGVLRRFKILRLDTPTLAAVEPAIQRGALHLIDARPPFVLERGWIVWWRHAEGALFSRVAAVPQDTVVRAGKRWAVRSPDGERRLLAPEITFSDTWDGRELARGEYVLLNDRASVAWPDSRTLGPIDRSAVVAHVLFAFAGGGDA